VGRFNQRSRKVRPDVDHVMFLLKYVMPVPYTISLVILGRQTLSYPLPRMPLTRNRANFGSHHAGLTENK